MPHVKKVCSYRLYLPALMKINNLNTVLTGTPDTSKLTNGVLHIYTLLLKDVVEKRKKSVAVTTKFPGYTQIRHETFRSYLGDNYLKVLNLLFKAGYLEMLTMDENGVEHAEGYYDFHYNGEPGRCKSYRIPSHFYSDTNLYSIIEHTPTKHDLNKKDAVNRQNIRYEEKYRNLVLENMRDIVLIDTPESRQTLQGIFTNRGLELQPEDYIEFFNHNPFRPEHVDPYGFRCHNPVTSQEKVMRPYQRFADDLGEPLSVLDFVASQPALIANINAALIKKLVPECSDVIRYFKEVEHDEQYLKYKKLAMSGNIYEYFVKKFNETFPYSTPIDRDKAKEIVYVSFFSNYDYKEAAKPIEHTLQALKQSILQGNESMIAKLQQTLFKKQAYALLKQEFPAVHRLFTNIKTLKWAFNEDSYTNNCLMAQRIESNLVYIHIAKNLFDGGVTRFGVIHDAFLVKKKDEAKARKIIAATLRTLNITLKFS